MPAIFRIEYRGLPHLSKSAENRYVKLAMMHIAYLWWKLFRLLHFTPRGARMYRYRRRLTKDIFSGQPRRSRTGRPLAPNGDPLTWEGESKELSNRYRTGGTRNWAQVTMPVRAFNFKPEGNKKLNMPEEFKTVLGSELNQLERNGAEFLTTALNKHNARRVVIVR